MVKLVRTRPLAALGIASAAVADSGAPVQLAEVPYRGLANLRIDPVAEANHVGLLSASLGVKLPQDANTSTQSETARCLWLSPDEWLVINSSEDGQEIVRVLGEELKNVHHSVKDVSHNYTTLRLQGEKARDVLSKLTPFDVHETVFAPGQCAQTVLAKSAVILDVVDGAPTFEITVRRSFATYVWQRIVDAGLEFGLEIEAFA